jgi:hypothetical protein
MRRRTALLAGMVGLLPVVSVAAGPPAGAYEVVTERRSFRFAHQGQQVSCSVEGRTGKDGDEGSMLFSVSTDMVDDDRRCRDALEAVETALGWWHTGDEVGQSAASGGPGPVHVLSMRLTNVERAQSFHEWHFDCDGPASCVFRFGVDVHPK